MYNSIADLLKLATEHKLALWQIVLENEQRISDCSAQEVLKKLDDHYNVMCKAAEQALNKSMSVGGGFIHGLAAQQYTYAKQNTVCGEFINVLMARALSCSEVNASMGEICAAPTAGACGVLPAVLITLGEKYRLSRPQKLQALLTAAGFGAIIMKNATVSGAKGGCQAECGSAAAMAAAAAVQIAGGSGEMSVNACSFALMNCLGLICDPVAGLVQIPCAQRNASQAINAILSADLALSGMKSLIPADEVVDAMYRVGNKMAVEHKETALGGLAATPTGKAIGNSIFS